MSEPVEYKLIQPDWNESESDVLNQYATDGWRVVSHSEVRVRDGDDGTVSAFSFVLVRPASPAQEPTP